MILSNLLSITANAYLSAAIWVLVILSALYLARGPIHRALNAAGNLVYRAMRTLAAATVSMDATLAERNRRVLLAFGRTHARRLLIREFNRIHSMVVSTTADYPRIERRLSELITRLESDYAKSADAPPSLPDWIPVIKTIAEIDHREDTLMGKMLNEIHQSLNEQQNRAAEAYRQSAAKRHRILAKWKPLWRKIQRQLRRSEAAIAGLSTRSETIDRYIAEYAALEEKTEQIEDILRAGVWKQFFISSFMLSICIGAGLLNYHLLAQATGAIITAADPMGPFTVPQMTALVIVLTAVGTGVFLMDALRATTIFPGIGSMEDALRRRFVWGAAVLLVSFAAFQGLLIYLAPGIAASQSAGSLASSHPLTTIGPAVLGVLLPLVLGAAAIPLETFAASTRAVAGFLARVVLAAVAVVFRLTGSLACAMTNLLTTCYDLIIFPAVWLENAITAGRKSPSDDSTGATPAVNQAASESADS
jgi:hypothetical protein